MQWDWPGSGSKVVRLIFAAVIAAACSSSPAAAAGPQPLISSTSWTAIGPAPIPNGQTTPVSAVSGRVSAIAVHPTNPNIVYVGAAQGGVYRSLDGGATWTELMANAQSLAIG